MIVIPDDDSVGRAEVIFDSSRDHRMFPSPCPGNSSWLMEDLSRSLPRSSIDGMAASALDLVPLSNVFLLSG